MHCPGQDEPKKIRMAGINMGNCYAFDARKGK